MNMTPYFERESLLSNFHAALDTALEELTLSLSEADWLRQLATDAITPDSMRIEAQTNAQPFSSGGLLIHQRDPVLHAVYFYSPLHGVQGFDNLRQLESALQTELAHLGVPTEPLEFVEVADPVFERWSERLLQQQVDSLDGLGSSLGQLPTLRCAIDTSVTASFAKLLEGVEDIPMHRVQIVANDIVVRTEALAEAALKVSSGESLGLGLRRRFLRGDVREYDATYDLACEQTLKASVKALPTVLSQALAGYWNAQQHDGPADRRGTLALALADNYAQALWRAAADRLITNEQLEWLRGALIPGTGTLRGNTLEWVLPAQADGVQDKRVVLADSLVLVSSAAASAGVFLFRPASGVRVFADQAGLEAHCHALLTRGERPASITAQDWQVLQHAPPATLHLGKVETPLFPALAEAIIALVNRRLTHALQYPGAQGSTAAAAVEDALDIRALIDVRLLQLDNCARWHRRAATHGLRNLPVLPDQSPTPAGKLTRAKAVEQLLQTLDMAQPDMRAVVKDLLSPCISALTQGSLAPDDLNVRDGKISLTLIDYFFTRLCSTQPVDESQTLTVLDRSGRVLAWPSGDAIREQVEAMTLSFSQFYLDQLQAFDTGQLRLSTGVFSVPAAMRSAWEALLRLELAKAREDQGIDAALLDLLQDALDRPRQSLLDARFHIRGLSLKMPGKSGIGTITGAFVLQRPAPANGTLLLWSPLEPLSQFDDEQALIREMDGALGEEEKLYQWLDLVHPEDLMKWHSPSVLPGVSSPNLILTTATTDIFAHLNASEIEYRANSRRYYLSYAIRSNFKPLLLERFVDATTIQQPLRKPLKHLERRLENQYSQSLLPTWLDQATAEQMEYYAALVQASAAVSNSKFNYLFDIPPINDFADEQLTQGLLEDYPDAPRDPRLITITTTHYSPNPVAAGQIPSPIAADTITTSKSLTEYALSHSSLVGQATTTSATATVPGQLAVSLDIRKLRAMVDRLDIASAYRKLMAAKLAPSSPDHAKRRDRYTHVATAYLMEEAYQHFLEKKISAKGMYNVSHVLNQPDALARDPGEGQKISISQLQLLAAPDLAPDTVRGLYVIGPDTPGAGPLVLYSAYLPDRLFREYADQGALRRAILTDTDLQQTILDRLPDAVHMRYNHKGFLHPHLFWSVDDILDTHAAVDPVQLLRSPIDGNAMHYLYEKNSALLNELAMARTVTTAEAKWQRFCYLTSLGIEQFSFFLPGKLAVVLSSLQSLQWLKTAGDAAAKGNWGESLAEFVTALSSLASLRAPQPALSRKSVSVPNKIAFDSAEMHHGWNDYLFSPSLQDRLSTLQTREFQLKDMTENTALGLYLNPAQDRFFAVVSGHAYEVKKSAGHWRIIRGDVRGPELKRVNDRWQVDFKQGLRGGGAAVSALETKAADIDIEARFTTLATGMEAISRLHPLKHAMLVRAYSRSRYYLENCLENLNASSPDSPLPPRTQNTLRSTFGHAASAQSVNLLRDYTKRLLNELLSASMSVSDSKRIVVGVNMPNTRDTFAFIYMGDPGKRIFLTERVFTLSHEISAYAVPSREELLAHQQGVTLIHELSHQVLKTADIAYLEASAPFLDQFSLQTAGGRKAHSEILGYRRDGLSSSTDPQRLFKLYDNFVWRDIRHKDGRALSTIYRLTGKSDLVEARKAFYDDAQVRTNVILANADSLALLISKLGRRRFAPAG